MPSSQNLQLALEKARQELQTAQIRVATLEAQLLASQPNASALQISEPTSHHALDAIPAICQIIGFDWRYRYLNDAAAHHERQTKEELLGHTLQERHPGIEETLVFTGLQRCMYKRSIEHIENEVTYPDGRSVWLELLIQPVPEGIFIFAQDITERKRAALAFLEREQQFQLFMEHAPAALAMLDCDMHYLLVSRRWLTDYRLPETNVIGRSHYALFPDLPEQWKEIHQRCLAGASASSEADPFPRADGSLDWVRWEIHPWRKLDGTIGGILIMSEVITERKRAEEQIRKLHRTLGVLSDINQAIVRIRHLPSLFEKACQIAIEKGNFRVAWLGLFHPKTAQMELVAYAGVPSADLEKLLNSLPTSPLSSALRAGERLICNDLRNDPLYLSWYEEVYRLGCNAMVALPLLVDGEVRGSFILYADEINFFEEQELRLIDKIAEDLSFALDVAEQDEQREKAEAAVKHYAQRLEILHQIDRSIINATSTEAIVAVALQHIRLLIPCQRANVALLDMSRREGVIFAANYDGTTALPPGLRVPITPDLFEGYDARHVRSVPDFRVLQEVNPRFKQAIKEGLHSGMSVLLLDRDQPIGNLAIFANTPAYFTAEHEEIIIEVGSQLAIAIRQMKLSEALAHHAATLEQKVIERTADLQASLVQVEAILHNSPDAILLASSDLTIQQANSSFSVLFGAEQDEYLGQSLLMLLPPDDESGISDFFQLATPHQNGRRLEVRAIRKGGTTFDAELSIGVIQGGGLVCNIRDITERKAHERQLRYHASIQESMSDAVIAADMQFRIQSWNRTAELIYGWSAAEISGKLVNEILQTTYESAEDRARILRDFIERGAWQGEVVQRRRDGSTLYVHAVVNLFKDEKGQPLGVVSVNRDITERKLAETALRESEEKFRLLLDAAPVATIISDHTGRISLVNVQAETLFGYSRTALTGQPVEILVPDYARDDHVNNRITYIATPRVRPMGLGMALYAKHKDGREIPVEIELSYIETRNGMMVISFIMDITERKRIAAELEQQRSFLRNVIDVSPNLIFVKDYEGRFVLVNSAVATMYHTTIDALVGKTDADFHLTQQEVDDFLAADRMVITSGKMLFLEESITNLAGKVHWLQTTKVPLISADGQSNYVLGISNDITERKEAEEALRASEEKYRSLVETMRGGLAVFDTEFRVTFVNDRFCELLGYSRAEVLGKHPTAFVDAVYLQMVQSHLERRQNAESTSYELPLRRKDGHQIHLLLAGSPLVDKQGNYSGSIVVATDISLQKQAEAMLRQALAKEKELGDLKTRFVSMASHEFRTPLATILALVETLITYRAKLSEEQIEQRFYKIKAQIGHLKNIMEDILLLSRMQAQRVEFNPVKLDLDVLTRSVLEEFQSQEDSKPRLAYTVNEEIRDVLLDRKLMQQILSNLVSNAIKYSPEGKRIHIHLEYTEFAVILQVSDEGIGIPEADRPHLFEPFHRATNVGTISGTGLGLVITREAVELHGGTIAVESQEGVGTTFTVRLPIATQSGQKN